MASCASRSAVSTWVSISASAVSILRCESRRDAAPRRCDPAGRFERAEPGGDDRQPQAKPGHQRGDRRMQLQPAVEDDAGQRRKALGRMGTHHGEHHVGAVAGGDDGHALGQPLEHMLGRHAGHQHIHRLARQQRRIAAAAPCRRPRPAARPPTGRPAAAPRAAHSTSARSASARRRPPSSATGRSGWPPPPRCVRAGPSSLSRHTSTIWATWSGVRSLAFTASTTGAPRLAAIRALVDSSLGAATSV